MSNGVTIIVYEKEILECDVSRVHGIFETFKPRLLERNRNRVEIMIQAYNDDSRELFLINEVRSWFHKLFEVTPELFFWLDLSPPWLTHYAIMFGSPVRIKGGTTVSGEDMKRFLVWGYSQLNSFCSQNEVSPEPSNEHIGKAIHAGLSQL